MKPFLGTEVFGNTETKERPFLAARAEEDTVKAMSEALNTRNALLRKGETSCLMRLLQGFSWFVVAVLVIGAGSEVMEGGLDTGEILAFLLVIAFFLGVAILLRFLAQRRAKKARQDPKLQKAQAEAERLFQAVQAQLGIPEETKTVDTLVFDYRMTDGAVQPVIPKNGRLIYKNPGMRFWCADGCLYIADLLEKYAVPLEDLRGIRTLQGGFVLQGWHKAEPADAPAWAEYGLFEDEEHFVQTRNAYVLEIGHAGESWGLWFPCYELPALRELTGIKA